MSGVQTRPVADKASLSGLRKSIRADLARAGADAAATFDCLVAVTEACTQVLLGDEQTDDTAISWSISRESATFVIESACSLEGCRATHPSGRLQRAVAAAPLLEEALGEDLPLALMKSLMDEVAVEDGPSGRRTKLTKLFPASL